MFLWLYNPIHPLPRNGIIGTVQATCQCYLSQPCFVFAFFLIWDSAITRCRSDPLSYFASTNIFLIFRGGETKLVFLSHPLVQSHHHLPVTHPLVTVALPSSFSTNSTNTSTNATFISSSFQVSVAFLDSVIGFREWFSGHQRRKGESAGSRLSIHFFLISRFHFTVFELRVFSSDSRAFRQGYCCIGGYAIDSLLIRSNRISLQSWLRFRF